LGILHTIKTLYEPLQRSALMSLLTSCIDKFHLWTSFINQGLRSIDITGQLVVSNLVQIWSSLSTSDFRYTQYSSSLVTLTLKTFHLSLFQNGRQAKGFHQRSSLPVWSRLHQAPLHSLRCISQNRPHIPGFHQWTCIFTWQIRIPNRHYPLGSPDSHALESISRCKYVFLLVFPSFQ